MTRSSHTTPTHATTIDPAGDPYSSARAADVPATTATRTGRIRDARDGTHRLLVYPARSVLVVAGIPGAGKTTLLRRLFELSGQDHGPVRTSAGVLVLDSQQARKRWRPRLHPIPYRFWRPLVYLTHYLWLWLAVRADEPLVLHDCGTRARLFSLLARWADRHHRDVHVILLDVPVSEARAGARGRQRPVNMASFARHAHRWTRLMQRLDSGPERVLPEARSITLLDRRSADRLSAVAFADPPSETAIPPLRTSR